jgi:hypothetical protein
VCRDLYDRQCGLFMLKDGFFGECDMAKFSASQTETLDMVIRDYGGMEPSELADLARVETPWKEARVGIVPGERGESVISKELDSRKFRETCRKPFSQKIKALKTYIYYMFYML